MKPLAIRAHQKGLELLCNVQPSVPEGISIDIDRVRQVLINLLGNAIKFTEEGEVELQVSVDSQSTSGVVLHFSVRDTGIGIPAEKQAGIFEAFMQADNSVTRRYGGTGLGLSISSRLIQLMNGRLWVVSQPGAGSTFHFTLPCAALEGKLAEAVSPNPEQLRGARILVVDDNAVNRRILGEMLSKWKVECILAEDGPTALQLIGSATDASGQYDLILLDAHMPGMDGFSVAHSIKDRPEFSGIPIMMLSSADLNSDAANCRRLGIETYLVKPICEGELREAVLRALASGTMLKGSAENKRLRFHSAAATRRILLVEDNRVNQVLALRLLEKQGHSVVVAGNGLEALEKCSADDFDVILMDIQMPEMDGLQASARIRDRERVSGKHIPILAMTALAMAGDRERCLAAGMDGYLTKPIRTQELSDALDLLWQHPAA